MVIPCRSKTGSISLSYLAVALDQHERHPSLVDAAEQARLDYRRGEWFASPAASAVNAEQARLDYRRGEWNASGIASAAALDIEQARIQWRRGAPVTGGTRDIEQARIAWRPVK